MRVLLRGVTNKQGRHCYTQESIKAAEKSTHTIIKQLYIIISSSQIAIRE